MLFLSRKNYLLFFIICLIILGIYLATNKNIQSSEITTQETLIKDNLQIEFSAKPIQTKNHLRLISEGELAEIKFKIKDIQTGTAASLPYPPKSWVSLQKKSKNPQNSGPSCEEKINSYSKLTLGIKPEIDLNSYFILVMNNNSSISVIDPQFGVGGMTQLYELIELESPGEDWVLSQDQSRIYVSLPKANKIAVIDTNTFKVVKKITVQYPQNLTLHPETKHLWVRSKEGIDVIDTQQLEVIKKLSPKSQVGEISFSFDSDPKMPRDHQLLEKSFYSMATNPLDGSVSLFNALSLVKIKDLRVGISPLSSDYSKKTNSFYVADEQTGNIAVIDLADLLITAYIKTQPGVKNLRISHDGQWGFALNPKNSLVDIINLPEKKIIYSDHIGSRPTKISFTLNYAYIYSLGTAEINQIDLTQLNQEKAVINRILGGQKAPGESGYNSIADPIFPRHGNHLFITSPADQYVYFYMEGMKAPMGGFQTYNHIPKAVIVVDRSLREEAPGEYTAKMKIPHSGEYQVAFLMDIPRIKHCFYFSAASNPNTSFKNSPKELLVENISDQKTAKIREEYLLKFKLIDSQPQKKYPKISDVNLIVTQASGQWQKKYRARAEGDSYQASLTLPRKGLFYIFLNIPSLKIFPSDLPPLTLEVTDNL